MPYLAGFVTPQDYGATGNGTTDDTAAIQAALNAVSSNGSTVFFPPGTYKISSGLSVTVSGTQIVGSGWGSQILFDGSTVTSAIAASGSNMRVFVRDIRISQSNASHVGTAINMSNTNNGTYERILIDGGGVSGVAPLFGITANSATCHHNTIRNCRINYGGSSSVGISLAGSSNSNTIQDCRLIPQGDNSTSSGIYITNTSATTIIHADIETGSGNGIWLDTAAHNTVMVNPFIQSMNIGIKITSGVIAPVVTGAALQTNTTANIQDNGAVAPQIMNAWPNSGSTTYNRMSFPNTDQFLVNGTQTPTADFAPQDQGLIAWGFDPTQCVNSTVSTSGTVYLAKMVLRFPATISKAMISLVTAASGVTANQNFLGLYDSAGTRQAVTAAGAIDAALASSGPLTGTFVTPYVAAAGTYWVAFLNNATTPAELARGTGFQSTPNANLTAANYRWAVNGTARTTLATSITPASNTSTNNITMWSAVL